MSSETAQLIQTLAVVVSAGIIAWYTWETHQIRKDAAEQNRLISEQLLTMQRSFDFEVQKESTASEPFFRWAGGSSGTAFDTCDFYNEGGPALDIGIGADAPGIEVRVTPRDVLQTNQKGTAHFKGPSGSMPKNFTFTLSYKTRLGRTGHRRYSLVHQSTPVSIQEA